MRQKYVSRKKEIVQWDYFTDGTYGGTRSYKSWVYKRADGSEFIGLEYTKPVKRDYKGKPYVSQWAWTIDIRDKLTTYQAMIAQGWDPNA